MTSPPDPPLGDLLDHLQLEWTPPVEPERSPAAEALHEAAEAGRSATTQVSASETTAKPDTPEGVEALLIAGGCVEGVDYEVFWPELLQGPNIIPWRTWRGPDEPIRITRAGVYQLEPVDYFADPVPEGSLSNSGIKKLMPPKGSPGRYRYDVDNGGEVFSDAFDLGHAVHVLALGKGEKIHVRPAEWDSYRTKASQQWLRDVRAVRGIPCTPEQYEQASAMAAALLAHDYAGRLLRQPGRPEMALFWIDDQTGVWRRILVDYLPDRPGPAKSMLIVDVKTAESCSPDQDMSKKVYDYHYHQQAATAMDGALALGLAEHARFFDLFVEKAPPYFVSVVELDANAIRIARIENRRALEVFAECQTTGVWPGPPNAIGEDALPVPAWVERQFEEEMEIR